MKRIVAIACLLFALTPLCAASAREGCLYPAPIDGKWGYINDRGETVIAPQWYDAHPFRGAGYAVVVADTGKGFLDDNRGIIDKQGNYVLEPRYTVWAGHCEYFGGRDTGLIRYGTADSLTGFFDVTTGFCSGLRYTDISLIQEPGERLIAVSPEETCHKVGFVDRGTGEWVLPPIYDYNHGLPTYFHQGYAVVSFIDDEEETETYAVIDETGAVIAPPEGFSVTYQGFSEELAAVIHTESGLYGYMDGTGALVIPPVFSQVSPFEPNGTARAETDGRAVVIDKAGNILDDEAVAALNMVKRLEFVCVLDGETYVDRVIVRDKAGRVLIPASAGYAYHNRNFHFMEGTYFVEGFQALLHKGKWGYIDERGEPITEFIYDDAYEFHQGLAMVEQDGKRAYIDYAGETVWRER